MKWVTALAVAVTDGARKPAQPAVLCGRASWVVPHRRPSCGGHRRRRRHHLEDWPRSAEWLPAHERRRGRIRRWEPCNPRHAAALPGGDAAKSSEQNDGSSTGRDARVRCEDAGSPDMWTYRGDRGRSSVPRSAFRRHKPSFCSEL